MAAANYDAEVQAIKDDVAGLRKDLQTLIKTVADDQKAHGKEALDKARAEVNRLASEARAKGREGVHALETQIEERPFTSVLVAFGIGLILGKLLDR